MWCGVVVAVSAALVAGLEWEGAVCVELLTYDDVICSLQTVTDVYERIFPADEGSKDMEDNCW